MRRKRKKKDSDNLPVMEDQNITSELVKSVCYEKGGSRQIEFMLYVLSGQSVAEAAKKTGYARNHGYRLMRKYRTNARFRQEVAQISGFFPEWYISTTKLKAPRLANLDDKVLDKYEDEIELAIKHPQALKQIKQTAGVLPNDNPQVIHETVNIDKLQMIVQNALNAADAEVVKPEQIEHDGDRIEK